MSLNGFPGQKAVFDAEVFPNYVSLNFQDVATGDITRFRITPDVDDRVEAEAHYRKHSVIVTYNGHGYDDHILKAVFDGLDCAAIYTAGDKLINSDGPRYSPFLSYGEPLSNHPLSIDLAQLAKDGVRFPGLKDLGLRFGYGTLQELPVAPGTVLSPRQIDEVDDYNIHDLAITRLVLGYFDADIETRRVLGELWGANLTSRGDGPLGEAVVDAAYTQRINAGRPAQTNARALRMPRPSRQKTEWVAGGIDLLDTRHSFTDPALQALWARVAEWTLCWELRPVANTVELGTPKFNENKLELVTPKFNEKVTLGDKTYSFGMGGLHSEDDPLITESDDNNVIIDIDASSFYPLLIKHNRLAPAHLDKAIFCDVYNDLIQRRLQAKRAGNSNVANGLKVAINAVYGKFSDPYSVLLDPHKSRPFMLQSIWLR